MGLIKNWIGTMGDTWSGMAHGDPNAFLGLPGPGGPSGTGHVTTRVGTGGSSGTGHGTTPEGSVLTERQRDKLNEFFHNKYGRYPVTEYEFQQWLRANW